MRIITTAAAAAILALGGCATQPKQRSSLVRLPPRCADQTVQIYFEPQSWLVTRESRQVISEAAAAARGCDVRAVEVTGLADAAGAPRANLELSRRRAVAVAQELAVNGLPPADFRVTAAGQAGAISADGHAAPLRRRADITLRLATPQ